MKKMLSLFLCLAFICSMIACTGGQKTPNTDSSANSEAETSEPIQVYYVLQDSYSATDALVNWYQSSGASVTIETTTFNTAEELEKALEGDEQPDVILLDKYSSSLTLNPFQWAKDGKLMAIDQYLSQDAAYDETNYIPGTIDAGKYGEEQYILPLSVSQQYLITDAETAENGSLSPLNNEYTAHTLLETLIADAKQHEGESDYCSQLPYFITFMNEYQWLYDLLEHTGALHVDRASKKVQIDPELFELTTEYFRFTLDMATPFYTGATNVSSMSLADLNDFCTAFTANRNMIYTARYMSSAYHQLLNQDAVLIPYELGQGGYSLNINVMGMVSAKADQPEAAVQFLRTLMDIPHDEWEMIEMPHQLNLLSPVNQNEALALIESFKTLTGSQFKLQKQTFNREALPEDLAAQLTDIIQNNQQAFIVDADICHVLETYLSDYINGQTDQLEDGLAEKIQKAIEDTLA